MILTWTVLDIGNVEKKWWILGFTCIYRDNNPCIYLLWFEFKDISHWYAQSCIFNRSLLSVKAEAFIQFTVLNKEVSAVRSLTIEFSPCDKPSISGEKLQPKYWSLPDHSFYWLPPDRQAIQDYSLTSITSKCIKDLHAKFW